MAPRKFKLTLEALLKKDSRLIDENKELNFTAIRDLTDKTDEKLIELLLSNVEAAKKFFMKVKEVLVFKQNDFKFFLDSNQINNSYTSYENRIGLANNSGLLKDNSDVVLSFPFKDCVLEGGQSTEEGLDEYFEYDDDGKKYEIYEAPRKEIFFNEVLAQDEIDRLFEPKAFTAIKKYTIKGEEKLKRFTRDKDGNITDNLIIKGNNLLALHSLKDEFKGRIKLIYIDPPYNTGSDSFKYNDSFNHSSWLVFMRNRLEIAYDFLKENGAIFVQVDHHEVGYLNILMDEIFKKENKVQIIAVKTASPAGFKTVNPGPIDVTEYILFYTKKKSAFKFKKTYVPVGYNTNYSLYVEKYPKVNDWVFFPIKEKILQEAGFKNEAEAKKKYGNVWNGLYKAMLEDFAFRNAENVVSIRDPHSPTKKVKELMEESKQKEKLIEYKREDNSIMYLYKGGSLAFYSNKIRVLDDEKVVTELLSDFWNHISWAGIAKEGGVKLKNGKKPEKLLKQLFELVSLEKTDVVLDFHLGSGTTAAVAHKMGIQYIGIEQLDYYENDSVVRIKNVINGDQTGVSKAVKWKEGGTFICLELKKWNVEAKEKIKICNSFNELEKLLNELSAKYFLHYNVKFKEFREVIMKEESFKKLPFKKQQEMCSKMLDLNQLYVNSSEMNDKKYGLSKEDINLTKEFYGKK